MEKLKIKIILLSASLIFSFLIIEISVRLLIPSSDIYFQGDDIVGWLHVKNKTGFFYNGFFYRKFETNSMGFVDMDYSIKPPHNTYRIAVLGDSFIQGFTVEQNETYQDVLEKMLNENSKGTRYEVINFGVGNYGTVQEYLVLKYFALNYTPDLIILGYFMNDYMNNYYNFSNDLSRPYIELEENGIKVILPKKPAKLSDTDIVLWENFHSFRFFKEILFKIIHPRETKKGYYIDNYLIPYHKNYTTNHLEAWSTTFAVLKEIKRTVDERKIKLIILILPNSFEIYDRDLETLKDQLKNQELDVSNYDINKPNKILVEFLKENNFIIINLGEEFRNNKEKKYYHNFDMNLHWNSDGNKYAAELTYKKLIAEGII